MKFPQKKTSQPINVDPFTEARSETFNECFRPAGAQWPALRPPKKKQQKKKFIEKKEFFFIYVPHSPFIDVRNGRPCRRHRTKKKTLKYQRRPNPPRTSPSAHKTRCTLPSKPATPWTSSSSTDCSDLFQEKPRETQ